MKRDASGLEDLVKASEAARRLGVHPNTLARWSDSGKMPHPVRVGPGQRRYYYLRDIDALVGNEGA